MNTPSFKALFFPYTLNTYFRQYKNILKKPPIPKHLKIRLLQGPEISFQCSMFKNGFRGPGPKVQGFRVQGIDVRLSVVPEL